MPKHRAPVGPVAGRERTRPGPTTTSQDSAFLRRDAWAVVGESASKLCAAEGEAASLLCARRARQPQQVAVEAAGAKFEHATQHSIGLEGLVGKKYSKDQECRSCMIGKSTLENYPDSSRRFFSARCVADEWVVLPLADKAA